MVCQRCRGLLVCETFDDLSSGTDSLYRATRCINWGVSRMQLFVQIVPAVRRKCW